MMRLLTLLTGLLLVAAVCRAESTTPLTGKKAQDSYSLGYEFGSNLRTQEVDLDEDVLIAAVREALSGRKPAMKPEDMQESLKQLRREVLIRYNLRRNDFVERNRKEGEEFLAANSTKEGVRTLPSGLQYLVLKEGEGPRPRLSDTVLVNYRGTLVSGTEVDSSYGRNAPATVRVDGTIKGWAEALQLMKTGAKWRLFVPAGLAYGKRQFGRIPPNSTLVFEMELVSIAGPGASEAAGPSAGASPQPP